MDNKRIAFLKEDFSQGFTSYIGMEATSISDGKCDSRIVVTPSHRQQDGFVHAGVISTLADHTAGYSAFSIAGEGMRILTIEFKINFLAPASGEELICHSQVIRGGKRVMVTESKVFDMVKGQRKQVAQALLTMAVVPQERITKPK